jgi:hypothetical protein
MSISEAIDRVKERLEASASRAGRNVSDIRLMAVSKFHDGHAVVDAYEAGIRLFGESRVQEAREKFSSLFQTRPDIELHLIGSLQRNKTKYAVELFPCVQSVDRDEIIGELARRAAAAGRIVDILFEMHTGEESKSGYPDRNALAQAVETALSSPSVRVRGLMTMAPFTEDQEVVRTSFRSLVSARDFLSSRFPGVDFSVLSMGMTNDFEIAVEEGSTLVRVGTAIFGPRPVGGDAG